MENNKNANSKREDYISWDEYFMGVAMLSAERSKDPNTEVGACIVSMIIEYYQWDIMEHQGDYMMIKCIGKEQVLL